MPYRRQERFLQVARLVLASAFTHVEHALPAASRRVDAICAPAAAPSPFWGAEGRLLAKRALLLEPFGAPPRAKEVISAIHKLVMATELWVGHEEGPFYPSKKGPALVIACPGHPGTALRLLHGLRPTEPGVWRTEEKPGLVVVVYDLRAIASTPGRSALAMTHWPDTEAEESEKVRSLLGDPKLPTVLKHRLMEAIMNSEIEVTRGEKKTAYERAVELGVRRGRRRGREEGLEEGREKGLEEGREKGLEEGREKGLEEGRRVASRVILEEAARFLPPEAVERLARAVPFESKRSSRSGASGDGRRVRG